MGLVRFKLRLVRRFMLKIPSRVSQQRNISRRGRKTELTSRFKKLFDSWQVFCSSEIPCSRVKHVSVYDGPRKGKRPRSLGVGGERDSLVPSHPGYLSPVSISHLGSSSFVIGSSQSDDLVFPMKLFPQKPIDLIVEISHFVIGQAVL
jgi:hypothetical protein